MQTGCIGHLRGDMDTNGSTGSPSRLNRPQSAFLGTSQYAYEELVAEMCSCFMGAELQMELYRRLQQQDKGS